MAIAARLQQRISIVGAGLPGLTAAHALHQAGFKRVAIYEAAPSFAAAAPALHKDGVVLSANGVRVLDRLGLAGPLYAQGRPLQQISHLSHAGHKLTAYSPAAIMQTRAKHVQPGNGGEDTGKRPQLTHIAIAGQRLYEALSSTLPRDVAVHFGAPLSALERKRSKVEQDEDVPAPPDAELLLRFGDQNGGCKVETDLLLADDGLRSRVREHFMSSEWRGRSVVTLDGVYVRGVSPRAVLTGSGGAELGLSDPSTLSEVWGRGCKLSIAPISNDSVMWLATVSSKLARSIAVESGQQDAATLTTRLAGVFNALPPACSALILAAQPDSVDVCPIEELTPPLQLHDAASGRIALMGSAAYAPVQEHWQSLAQGLEDAGVLATLLYKMDRSHALAAYSQLRVPRASFVVRSAHDECAQALQSGRVLSAFRDMASSMMPANVQRDMAAQLITTDAIKEAEETIGNE